VERGQGRIDGCKRTTSELVAGHVARGNVATRPRCMVHDRSPASCLFKCLGAGAALGNGRAGWRTASVNEDFLDMLRALPGAEARFLIVGAHALAGHGVPRATGELDIWVEATADNAARVWPALLDFGAPVAALGIRQQDFTTAGLVIRVGLPPDASIS